MARTRTVAVAGLNVVIFPNGPERYITLFEKAAERHQMFQLRGENHIMLGYTRRLEDGSGMYGELYKFLEIDPAASWFNTETLEEIEVDEDNPPPVPEHLKPNFKRIPFVFFAENHTVVFDTTELSPKLAEKGLNQILNDPALTEDFGNADVNLITSRESLERMLRIPTKTKLIIDINVPNPDELSAEEQRVLDRFQEENARRAKVEKTAHAGESLEPDEETKAMMSLARRNGVATIHGKNAQERKIEESTKDHPLKQYLAMQPNETPLQFVLRIGSDFLDFIREN